MAEFLTFAIRRKSRLPFILLIGLICLLAVSSIYLTSHLRGRSSLIATRSPGEADHHYRYQRGPGIKPDKFYANYEKECSQIDCSKILADNDTRFPNLLFENRGNFLDLRRVLLIVQFNFPHYGAASKMYAIYSRIFGRVVFCGPSLSENEFWPNQPSTRSKFPLVSLPEHLRFYAMGEQFKTMGENGYICFDLVMQDYDNSGEDFPFEGIMLVADDAIINYWKWKMTDKSLNKNWLMTPQTSFPTFDVDKACYCKGYSTNPEEDCFKYLGDWSWHASYREETQSFYSELERLALGSNNIDALQQETLFWRQFFANLTRATSGAQRRLHQGYADVVYIGKAYLPIIRPIFRLMNKYHLFIEFAVPSAIRAVSGFASALNSDLQLIDSRGHDWRNGVYRGRPIAEVYWVYEFEMFHPFKLGLVFPNLTNQFEPPVRGDNKWNKKDEDPTADCVFCYLRNLSLNYAANVYKDEK